MFGRLSGVLQSAADVLAPPPSPLEDFKYHWKIVKQFYIDENKPKVHLNDTNIPYHLEEMLQILIKEVNNENEKSNDCAIETEECDKKLNPCLDFLLNSNLLDIIIELGIADSPPGARLIVLNWVRRFLSCLTNPPIEHDNIFQPALKLVQICKGEIASPYEKDEILFLVTVAGLVRKNPILVHIFLPYHQHSAFVISNLVKKNPIKIPKNNSLFDNSKIESNIRRISLIHDDSPEEDFINKATNSSTEQNENKENLNINKFICDCEKGEMFYLLDVILSYFESPDSIVVVRACEGALILASLFTNDTTCSAIQTSLKLFIYKVIDKIVNLFKRIPEDMDLGDIDEANVAWGLIPRETEVEHFIGRYQLFEFLCWLDYCDCIARECPAVHQYLGENLRNLLLEQLIEPAMLDVNAAFMTVLSAKIIRQFRSDLLKNEIANWLVGNKSINEINGSDTLLTIIIENAQDHSELIFQTLQFIEALIDNPHEKILHGMIFFYLNNRGYYDVTAQRIQSWSDEEDERIKRRGSIEGPMKSRTLSPKNILKIINNFLLLLPRQIIGEGGGTCYEEYVQDANRHYQIWIKKTDKFNWPCEAVFNDNQVQSEDESVSPSTSLGLPKKSFDIKNNEFQCNDSGISEENFYEGPLLRMLFNHVKDMSSQPYELNLAVIAILSKLALLPHPYLHEILLNSEIPVALNAKTLWTVMQILAKQLLLEIPRIENFQQKIIETGKRLLVNPPMLSETNDEGDPLFESIIVLEEFCKELAAIAFVKYHHATE